jgi:hypothetical protein
VLCKRCFELLHPSPRESVSGGVGDALNVNAARRELVAGGSEQKRAHELHQRFVSARAAVDRLDCCLLV